MIYANKCEWLGFDIQNNNNKLGKKMIFLRAS